MSLNVDGGLMILAISRFRVANGMEQAVRDAFACRPHLVDSAPGFLGMEVFTDAGDASAFSLVTRWTNADCFHAWHASDAHRLSHKGIPRGLKLDRSQTQVVVLDRLPDQDRPDCLDAIRDNVPLVARYLANSRTAHLIAASPEGTIRSCTAAFPALLQMATGQIVNGSLWSFLPDADAAALRRRVSGAAPKGETFLLNVVDAHDVPHTLDCCLDVQPDGFCLLGETPRKQDESLQQEMVQLNNELALLTRENARKSRALAKALDELKQAQAMLVHQEKMASLGQMTAGVAHEINNPLAFVLNNQSILKRDFEELLGLINLVGDSLTELAQGCPAVAERIVKKAGEIDLTYLVDSVPRKIADNLEGLERVRQIVLDLRNFSRLDEGDLKVCDVAEGVRSGLHFLSSLLTEHGVSVDTDFPPLPPLACSPGQLNQAVSNVVANAVQASRPGQRVKVRTAHEDGYFTITVEDEGSGIAPENLSRVFDPFFTTKPVGAGTGLGLSIAYQILKAHRGDIQIASKPGKGTTVRLRIPLEPGTGANQTEAGIVKAENQP